MALPTLRSRGDSPSSYYPGFSAIPSGIKMRVNDLECQVLSGTVISAGIVYAVTHNLGRTPQHIAIRPSPTLAQTVSAHLWLVNVVDHVSASTSAKVYIASNNKGLKYAMFLVL